MRRTDLMDTPAWAHRAMVERLRALTPEERLLLWAKRMEAMRQLRECTKDLRRRP